MRHDVGGSNEGQGGTLSLWIAAPIEAMHTRTHVLYMEDSHVHAFTLKHTMINLMRRTVGELPISHFGRAVIG